MYSNTAAAPASASSNTPSSVTTPRIRSSSENPGGFGKTAGLASSGTAIISGCEYRCTGSGAFASARGFPSPFTLVVKRDVRSSRCGSIRSIRLSMLSRCTFSASVFISSRLSASLTIAGSPNSEAVSPSKSFVSASRCSSVRPSSSSLVLAVRTGFPAGSAGSVSLHPPTPARNTTTRLIGTALALPSSSIPSPPIAIAMIVRIRVSVSLPSSRCPIDFVSSEKSARNLSS